jgi:uncharacterized MnhB-related membrane protein
VTVLQVVALVVVAVAGTVTVAVRHPVRQAVVSGVFGLTLALLFFVFGAPDVALSELAVASIVVPVMVLLTLSKLSDEGEDR